MMVDNVRSGSMAMADLETWLVFQERSGGLTPEEVASFRAAATGA